MAAAVHEVTGVYLLKRYLKIQAFTLAEGILLIVACAVLCLAAFNLVSTVPSVLLLLVLLAINMFVERVLFTHIAGDLLRIVKRNNA